MIPQLLAEVLVIVTSRVAAVILALALSYVLDGGERMSQCQCSFRDSPFTGVLSAMTPKPHQRRSRPNSSLLPTTDNSSTTTPTILQKFDKDLIIGCKYIPTFHSACPPLPIGKSHKPSSGTPPPLGPNEAIGPTKRTSPPRRQKNSRSEPSCFFKYNDISIHIC
jgi:hypothetical protein